jgi:hypothetical protein
MSNGRGSLGGIGSGWNRGAALRCEGRVTLDVAQFDVGSSWHWYGPDRRAAKFDADPSGVTIIYGHSDEAGRISEVSWKHAPFHSDVPSQAQRTR